MKGALSDKYFRQTVINGGSISSRFAAQPISRRGCRARAVPFSALGRSAPRTEIKATPARGRGSGGGRGGGGGGIVLLIMWSHSSPPQNSPSRARTGEAAAFVAHVSSAPDGPRDKSESVRKKNSLIVGRSGFFLFGSQRGGKKRAVYLAYKTPAHRKPRLNTVWLSSIILN